MSVFDDLANEYTDEEVAATLAELRTWLAEVEPTVDPYDPVVNSVLLAPLAVMLTKQRKLTEVTAAYGNLSPLPSQSLSEAQLIELRTLQARAFGLEPGSGSYAVGDARVSLLTNESIAIQAGAVFSAGGLFFETSEFYYLVPEAEYTGDAEQLKLQPAGDGTYYATIRLQASLPGVTGNISAGSALQAVTTLPRLASVVSSSAFVGGTDATDLAALLRDAFDSLVPRTMGSRDQIISMIRYQPQFSNLTYFGVVGSGDPEMQRDKVGLLPLGTGRTDIYAAASASLATRTVSLTGITGSAAGARQTITIAIDRNVAPGFYKITEAKLADGTALTVSSVTRGIDTSDLFGEQPPIVSVVSQATFSRFQTATVVVTGDTTAIKAEADTEVNVQVTFLLIPNIDTLQSFVSDRSRRYPGGDTLVRAAVPIFLEVILGLNSLVDEYTVNEEAIVSRIVSHLQSRPLRTMIYGSEIVAAVSDLLGDKLFVSSINFVGRMIRPDGESQLVGGTNDLLLEFDPKDQLSPRTVAMYLTASDVRLQFSRVISPEVP